MNESEVGGFIFSVFCLFIIGIGIGGCVCDDAWQDSAKARGAMEYNKQTGILEWKPDLQRKDAK